MIKQNSPPEGGYTDKAEALEDIKTFFKFVFVKVIILGKKVMHVEQDPVSGFWDCPAELFMQNADKAGNEVSAFIHLEEKPENDAVDSQEEAVKQGAVNAVFATTGRAKFGMAAKGNKFKFPTMGTAIHSATERGISTVNHLFIVFYDNGAGMKDILNFFIVIYKNLLEYVHKSIMQEMWSESNPNPQD